MLWKPDLPFLNVGLGNSTCPLLGSLYPQEARCESNLTESKQKIVSECFSFFLTLAVGLVAWPLLNYYD